MYDATQTRRTAVPRPLVAAGTLVIAALAVVVAGCNTTVGGYATGEQFDRGYRTVAVPIFANRTFDREAEFRLSEALTKEIEARTPYKVAAAGSADTILTGTVLAVDRRLLSRERETGIAQEVQVRLVVSFEWKDLRTGKVIRQRSRFEGTGEHVPTDPLSEPFEVALIGATDELAREIVSVMRSDW